MEHRETESRACCPAETRKTKERPEKEYQVRGLQKMLEENAYCTDVMVQASAVSSALNGFNKALLENHIRTCVAENIRQGNDNVIDELTDLLRKLMK